MSSTIKIMKAENTNRVLYLTPRVLTAVIAHALAGVDSFIISDCTQRTEYIEDSPNIDTIVTHLDITFIARYTGRTRWEINILS